jgi:hypothetical protein
MEAKILKVEGEIDALKFLLSNRRVGDPENPYIMVYENYTIEELKIKEHDLQTEKNLLIQQRTVPVQASAGK